MNKEMPDFNEIECQNALIDVRKGFRLLFLFHRRVHDICNEIINRLVNYRYYYSFTSVGHGIEILEKEDVFIPTIRYLYLPDTKLYEAENGDNMLELIIVADDHFEEFSKNKDISAEKSKSGIILRVYLYTGDAKRNWANNICKPYQHEFGNAIDYKESKDKTVKTFSKDFDFCQLFAPNSIQLAVEQFKEEVKEALKIEI